VVIAACDGLLTMVDHPEAITRLLAFCNPSTHGDFVPVAALNVIDDHVDLSPTQRRQLEQIPIRSDTPAVRASTYVKRMLDTIGIDNDNP